MARAGDWTLEQTQYVVDLRKKKPPVMAHIIARRMGRSTQAVHACWQRCKNDPLWPTRFMGYGAALRFQRELAAKRRRRRDV